MSTPEYGSLQQGNDGDSDVKAKAQQAASQGKEVGQHAADAGKAVKDASVEGVQQMTEKTREQAAGLAQEASKQVHVLSEETATQLREQAGTQIERLSQQLRQLVEQGNALVEGRTDEAGPLPQYARQAGEKLSNITDRLENEGIDGVLADARSFARRRPGAFLLLAGAVGFGAGRMLKGAKTAQQNPNGNDEVQSGYGTTGAPAHAQIEPVVPLEIDDVYATPGRVR